MVFLLQVPKLTTTSHDWVNFERMCCTLAVFEDAIEPT
jgi:hypothetical protein